MAVILGDLFSDAAADGILLRHLGFAMLTRFGLKNSLSTELVGRFDSARSKEKPQARRAAHHSSTLPCGARRFTVVTSQPVRRKS
jgi:hypothetical protein